jgi:ketosteroid isomerase-like protein
MKTYLPFLIFLYLFYGCSENSFEKDKIAIKKIMDQQSQCWSNGDIDGFMNGYWKSDSLRFLGRKGLTKGWQATLDNYKKSYPDKQTMGKLKFTHISFEPLNNTQMFVVGKWSLEREKDTLRGYYSILWRKFDGQWKVIFDHSS